VDGEINQPFTVVPEVKISIDKDNVFVINSQPQILEVQVSFEDGVVDGELMFDGLTAKEYQQLEKRVDDAKNNITFKVQLQEISGREVQVTNVNFRTADGRIADMLMTLIS